MDEVGAYPGIGAVIGGFAGLVVYILVCNYIGIFSFSPIDVGWNVFVGICVGGIAGYFLVAVVTDEIGSEIGVILGGILGALVGGYIGYYIASAIMASSLGIILGVVTGIVVYCILEEYYRVVVMGGTNPIIYILWGNEVLCPIIGAVIGGIIYWIGWKLESEFIANIILIPIFVFIGYALGGLSNRKEIQKINDYKSHINFWKRCGYDLSGLEEVMKMRTGKEFIERKFKDYEEKIQRLKQLERELSSLNTEGFESEVRSIISKIKGQKRIEEAKSEIAELKQKIIEKERKRIEAEKRYRAAKDQIKSAESVIEKTRDFGCDIFEAEELIENAERAINIRDYEKAIRNAKEAKEVTKEIKRKSKPEISVELSKGEFQQGIWEDVSLKISNDGNAHAKDIEIGFSKEVKVKGLVIIERLNVREETELEVSFKSIDVRERVPLEISTRFKDLEGKRYEETDTVYINVGRITKEEVKEYEIPIGKREMALTIERAIYDPCKRDFIEGVLPRMKEWINRYDSGAYWFAVSIQNNTDKTIEEWGVELETSSALKVEKAIIEGMEYKIELRETHPEPYKNVYAIGVPKEYGIVIPKGGAQRVYFKLHTEKPKTTYEISGVFKSMIGDVPIRPKEFKYLCDAGVSPEAVKTELKKTFSEKDATRLANAFRIAQDIRNNYCNTDTTAREINKEFDVLKMYLTEKEFLDEVESIQRKINAELREEERLDDKHVEEVKDFCEKFIEKWIAKFLR